MPWRWVGTNRLSCWVLLHRRICLHVAFVNRFHSEGLREGPNCDKQKAEGDVGPIRYPAEILNQRNHGHASANGANGAEKKFRKRQSLRKPLFHIFGRHPSEPKPLFIRALVSHTPAKMYL